MQRLERDVAYKEARKRGWFSYTDLNSLLDTVHLNAFVNTVIHACTVFLATYTLGVGAVLGSSAVASYLPKTLINSLQETLHSGIPNTCSNNLQYVPQTAENSSVELEEQIENIILKSVSTEIRICNQSFLDREISERNISHEIKKNRWEWLVDSVTFWLPIDSNSKIRNCTNHSVSKLNYDSLEVTKSNYIMESNFSSQNSNKKSEIIKNKSLDLSAFSPNWRLYICYLSQTTLSY